MPDYVPQACLRINISCSPRDRSDMLDTCRTLYEIVFAAARHGVYLRLGFSTFPQLDRYQRCSLLSIVIRLIDQSDGTDLTPLERDPML